MSTAIKFSKVDFSYPVSDGLLPVFSGLDISIPRNKVTVVLGPSGCGKSTLLSLIRGILEPDSGNIIREETACGRISYLFQEPRLLPWRTVEDNIELVLKKHYEKSKRTKLACRYLNLVGLEGYGKFYPDELSGGMRQRVSAARAFAYPADMILMDEPFQALDLGLKLSLTDVFRKLWVEDPRTAVFVTHDINEAVLLGDEIRVFSAGHPAVQAEHITNMTPSAERRLDSEASLEIERKLYKILAGGVK